MNLEYCLPSTLCRENEGVIRARWSKCGLRFLYCMFPIKLQTMACFCWLQNINFLNVFSLCTSSLFSDGFVVFKILIVCDAESLGNVTGKYCHTTLTSSICSSAFLPHYANIVNVLKCISVLNWTHYNLARSDIFWFNDYLS